MLFDVVGPGCGGLLGRQLEDFSGRLRAGRRWAHFEAGPKLNLGRLGANLGVTLRQVWAFFRITLGEPNLGPLWKDSGPIGGEDFGLTSGHLWADFALTLVQLWVDLLPTLG